MGLIRNPLHINSSISFQQAGFDCDHLQDSLALTGRKSTVLKCNTEKFLLSHIPIHMDTGTSMYFSTLK